MVQERTARILVIDDELAIRQTVERVLSPSYEVRTLASSEKLEETLRPFSPDLFILDIRMEYEDGWRLCQRLRQQKRFNDIPVIFLSALGDEASVRKGYVAGADYFIPKPFDIHQLVRVVETFLGRKHCYPNE